MRMLLRDLFGIYYSLLKYVDICNTAKNFPFLRLHHSFHNIFQPELTNMNKILNYRDMFSIISHPRYSSTDYIV